LNKKLILDTVVVPIVAMCVINLLVIILIIRARCSIESAFKKGFKSAYRLSTSKINLFTMLTCALFSGNMNSWKTIKKELLLSIYFVNKRNLLDSNAVDIYEKKRII